MKNFVEPMVHPSSPWTGSPSEDLVDEVIRLETGYFACADHGYLMEVLKTYRAAQKKGVKFIPGVEIYFRDDDCPLARNTESENLKYFHLGVHCKDQVAYQHLCNVMSGIKKTVHVRDTEFPLFGWEELADLCKTNVTLMSTNVQGMVAKHLLVNRPDVGVKYYERLKNMVGPGDFYTCVVPLKFDSYWRNEVVVKLRGADGEFKLDANDIIETNRSSRARARYLTDRNTRHTHLIAFCYNRVRYEVNKDVEYARGSKGFYELGFDIQLRANQFHKALANRYGDKFLISAYPYFSKPENKLVQDMRLGEDFRHQGCYHVRGNKEVALYLRDNLGMGVEDIKRAIEDSYEWAAKFDGFKLEYDYALPDPCGNPTEILVDIVKKVGRMRWDDPVYVKRFKHELETIRDNSMTDLIPYFFPIRDVLDHYKENDELVGPGRGSAGASLIAYCMGITQLDPVYYDLPFSRFLSARRIDKGDFPDIDVDLPHRDLLVGKDGNGGYLYNRWGDKACQISTRTMMRLKSAIKDVNRFKNRGTVEPAVEKFAAALETPPQGMKDKDFVFGYEKDEEHVPGLFDKSKELQEYAKNRPDEWEVVSRCLGIPRQNSRHASAFIIADRPVREVVPLMRVGGVNSVSQPEAGEVEFAKLIKYDFLVISMLKDIGMCLRLINKRNGDTLPIGTFKHKGEETYIWKLPVDREANEQMWNGHTETTWQTNTKTMKPYVMAIKPGFGAKTTKDIIVDYATIGALVRPGPLDFVDPNTGRNMAQEYVERRFGRSQPDIQVLADYLPETYGVIVFQEQITRLANELADMPVDDAEDLRKFLCKKKKVQMLKLKPSFMEGAARKIGQEMANSIWERMETFAQYGFSIIHATEYALITYACVFLKHNYPLEWWTSVLTNADEKEIVDEFWKYVKDKVTAPDINLSTEKMAIDYRTGTIRSKLSMIEGISGGGKIIRKIIDGRPYKDIEDMVRKNVAGAALIRKMIVVGALDSLFPEGIRGSMEDKILEHDRAVRKIEHEGKMKAYREKIKLYEIKLSDWEKAKALGQSHKKPMRPKEPVEKKPTVDPIYSTMTPMQEMQLKKGALPSLVMDLRKLMLKHVRHPDTKVWEASGEIMLGYVNSYGEDRETALVAGDKLKEMDEEPVNNDVTFAVAAYVLEAKEFTYHQVKKAFKMTLDVDGYINEKIIWPDINSGKLKYPEGIKKGAVAVLVLKKKVAKDHVNVREVWVDHPPLGKV